MSEVCPAISVIVPVYNTSRYLPMSLDVLLGQTFKDIEIIAVDDGSTDNSVEILQAYARKDSRVRIFTQLNSRQGAARNRGLREARGRYICYVDSDDLPYSHMLEALYTRAEKTGADIVMCNFLYMREGEFFNSPAGTFDERFLKKEVWRVCEMDFSGVRGWTPLVVVWNKLFRRELALSHVHFPEKIVFEDSPAMYEAFYYAQGISVISEPLYRYRVGNPRQTTAADDLRAMDVIKIAAIVLNNAQSYQMENFRNNVIHTSVGAVLSKFKAITPASRVLYYNKMREFFCSEAFCRDFPWKMFKKDAQKIRVIQNLEFGVYRLYNLMGWLLKMVSLVALAEWIKRRLKNKGR